MDASSEEINSAADLARFRAQVSRSPALTGGAYTASKKLVGGRETFWSIPFTTFEDNAAGHGRFDHGGDVTDWFFLAMTHWQLSDKAAALKWYDKAVQWM
jgi:hypothetical protein